MSFSFYINNCSPTGGPGIFGGRLKKQFEKKGIKFYDKKGSGRIKSGKKIYD